MLGKPNNAKETFHRGVRNWSLYTYNIPRTTSQIALPILLFSALIHAVTLYCTQFYAQLQIVNHWQFSNRNRIFISTSSYFSRGFSRSRKSRSLRRARHCWIKFKTNMFAMTSSYSKVRKVEFVLLIPSISTESSFHFFVTLK